MKPFTPTVPSTPSPISNAITDTQAGMCGTFGVSAVRNPSLM